MECLLPSLEVVQVPDEVLSLLAASAAAAERLYFDSFVGGTALQAYILMVRPQSSQPTAKCGHTRDGAEHLVGLLLRHA